MQAWVKDCKNSKARNALVLAVTVALAFAMNACGGQPTSGATSTQSPPYQPVPTPSAPPTAREATALPSDLQVTWGEWWYEGEYLASKEKYPADAEYHDRSFNVRVAIRNTSQQALPGDVVPVFYLTDGEEERPVITWYYSPEDLRPLEPGEEKEAVFRALTYAPGQWIRRAEIRWRGQVWTKEFPRQ